MEQFENYVRSLSNSKLLKKLKELEKNAEDIGKNLYKVSKEERDMYTTEYKVTLTHIDQIKAEMQKREERKKEKDHTTMETLFPTVTKIIEDHKAPVLENENIEEETINTDIKEIEKEVSSDEKELIKEQLKEELKEEIYKELKQELANKTEEPTKSEKDILSMETTVLTSKDTVAVLPEVKSKSESEPKSKPNNTSEIAISESDFEAKPKDNKPVITEPIRPKTILEEIKSDGSIEKVSIGTSEISTLNDINIDTLLAMEDDPDSRTSLLATTKEDIINRPVELLTDESLKYTTENEAIRELELAIVSRDIVKSKILDKSITEELKQSLLDKLDIINKNINKLKLKTATT